MPLLPPHPQGVGRLTLTGLPLLLPLSLGRLEKGADQDFITTPHHHLLGGGGRRADPQDSPRPLSLPTGKNRHTGGDSRVTLTSSPPPWKVREKEADQGYPPTRDVGFKTAPPHGASQEHGRSCQEQSRHQSEQPARALARVGNSQCGQADASLFS